MKQGRSQMFSAMQTNARLSTASETRVMTTTCEEAVSEQIREDREARTRITEMTVFGTERRFAWTVVKPS